MWNRAPKYCSLSSMVKAEGLDLTCCGAICSVCRDLELQMARS